MPNHYISTDITTLKCFEFKGIESTEFQWTITAQQGTSFATQLQMIEEASILFLQRKGLTPSNVVFRRYFFSDISNQISQYLNPSAFQSPISLIQQAPASGHKIAAWFTAIKFEGDTTCTQSKQLLEVAHNGYRHLYSGSLQAPKAAGSEAQGKDIFEKYVAELGQHRLTLQDNCIRTWLFVRDIDNNYHGMVVARNNMFAQCGLTPDSHFIASTGIEGQTAATRSLVSMDAYAIGGIEPRQITYIKALDHLNPTHEYGVAFERATAVDYGDRRQIFVSGTASIDNRGQILHLNDIEKQADRVVENISALLGEAEAQLSDIASMIVYLRDLADYSFMAHYMGLHFHGTPYVIVLAPVCRHGWLVEIECMAIKHIRNKGFRNF